MNSIMRAVLVAALALGFVVPQASVPAWAQGDTTQPIKATDIHFIYPDTAQVSNDPYPPDRDQAQVDSQLKSVMVTSQDRTMTLGDFLKAAGYDLTKIMSVRVQNGTVAVYTPRPEVPQKDMTH